MHKTYIIAEAGVNHNGRLDLALKLIDAAATAGADAVKFQTFKSEELANPSAPKANYQKLQTDVTETQFEMLKKLELPFNNHLILKSYAEKQGIDFLSSPFDSSSASFLINELNLQVLKVGSGEITNLPLLLQIARAHINVILSTGMSTLGDIELALSTLAWGYLSNKSDAPNNEKFLRSYFSQAGQTILREKVSLLHCTTEYPAPFNEINLKVIHTLKQAFNLRTGYSDHSKGNAVSIAAVALGASIIEKHFTLDKNMQGPDHQASLDPIELKLLVDSIRQVESALGISQKIPSSSEIENRLIARKSIVAKTPIQVGDTFNTENITCKRPGTGKSAQAYFDVLASEALRQYEPDDMI